MPCAENFPGQSFSSNFMNKLFSSQLHEKGKAGYLHCKGDWLSATSGVLLAAAFPPFNLHLLIGIAFVPMLFAIQTNDLNAAFRVGFITGAVFFSILVWWIAPAISVYGKMPWFTAWPVTMLLVIYLALFTGIWGMCLKFIFRYNNEHVLVIVLSIFSSAALWTLLEWFRGVMVAGGFPWGSLAYALSSVPELIQSACIWSIYGISFFIMVFNMGTYLLIKQLAMEKRDTITSLACLMILPLTLLLLYTFPCTRPDSRGKEVFVAALQGAFAQDIKWDPAIREETVTRYAELGKAAFSNVTHNTPYRLAIWPETALPFYFQQDPPWQQAVIEAVMEYDADTITGSQSYDYDIQGNVQFMNSAYMITRDGKITGRYDKQHLVPFGEYLPLEKYMDWARKYMPTLGNFRPGDNARPLTSGEIKAGVLICFESIFPDMARKTVIEGANMLVVMTNDAWFGNTGAPYQHAEMAIFRAVETGRWLVRAANTGISEIVSPDGTVKVESRLLTPEYITGTVTLYEHRTFYVKYGIVWFLLICAGIIFLHISTIYYTRKDIRNESAS
jgi:apolipoprotein N-acyltransferase